MILDGLRGKRTSVKVTNRHIDEGTCSDAECCAVAMAISESVIRGSYIHTLYVSHCEVYMKDMKVRRDIGKILSVEDVSFSATPVLKKWLEKYDRWHHQTTRPTPEPFILVLDWTNPERPTARYRKEAQ